MKQYDARSKKKFLKRCCRREVYATIMAMSLWIFFLVALIVPWYQVAATNLPPPHDSMTAIFWWNGMDAVYSPPLQGTQRSLSLSWSEMISTRPRDVYYAAMSMCILGILSATVLIAAIFLGFIFPRTARMLSSIFCNYFKWPVVILCYVVLIFSILSWTCFFAMSNAMNAAQLCAGTTAYGAPIFPSNDTWVEPMFCDSFANTRTRSGPTWVWGPQAGWFFALFTTPLACVVLWIMLTLPSGPNWEKVYVEELGFHG